jgi:hypothetical protein
LIDLTTVGLALSNSKAAIRSRCKACKTPNYQGPARIFDERARRHRNIVNAGFRGRLEPAGGTAQSRPQAIRLMAKAQPRALADAQLSALPKQGR